MTDPNDGPDASVRFLGLVEVDSGTLVLGDPVYLLRSERDGRAGVDWQTVLEAPNVPVVPLAAGTAMLLGAFGGDGSYPVFAELDEDGVVARVTVHFVEPDEM
jgi:hypothetical protein